MRAYAGDAAALADIGAETFRDTWRHLYEPSIMDDYLAQAFVPEVIAAELQNPAYRYWVVRDQEKLAAYLKAGPVTLAVGEAPAGAMELQRLYVLPEYKGRGLGKKLLAVFEDYVRDGGFACAFLSVWTYNFPALALYRGVGFKQVGQYYFSMNGFVDESIAPDLIFRKDYA